MKKIVLIILFLGVLTLAAKDVAAQGTFFCSLDTDGCKTVIRYACESGKVPVFSNGKKCEDLSAAECNSNSFDRNCITPAEEASEPTSCTPGTQLCTTKNGKNYLATCDLSGQNYNYQECSSCSSIGFGTAKSFVCKKVESKGEGPTDGSGSVIDLNALIQSIPGFKFAANTKLGTIVGMAIPIILALAGIGLLFFMIRAGFMFLTSAGDPKKLEAAKGALTAAVIGFIIVFIAFWLVEILGFVFKIGPQGGN